MPTPDLRLPINGGRCSACGFTLIELIAALVVMGILAATAMVSATPDARIATQSAVLGTHIRFAQSMAMKQAQVFGLSCDGDEYWVFQGTPATPVQLAGEAGPKITLAGKGVALTAFSVFFDRYGVPYTDAAMTAKASAANPVSATLTSPHEACSRSITITPDTGFVP